MKENFIKITDNISDIYHVNIDNIAYLKEGFGNAHNKPIYKIVLMNDKQILLVGAKDFIRIKNQLYGE
tara:strand:+ start:256 stop:459 length:204 start_codon:yes stop_codon:yes gene_type:complete